MQLPSHKETLYLLETAYKAALKKDELLQANKEAARALLASIVMPSVSYVTEKKNESAE